MPYFCLRQDNTFRVFRHKHTIRLRRLGNQRRNFLALFSHIKAQEHTGILLMPVIRQSHQPHLHIALLHKPPQKGCLIQLPAGFFVQTNILMRHGKRRCHLPHRKGSLFQQSIMLIDFTAADV